MNLEEGQYRAIIGNTALGLSTSRAAIYLVSSTNGGPPPVDSPQQDTGVSDHDDVKKSFRKDSRDMHTDMQEPDLQMPSRANQKLVQQGKVVNLTLGEKQADEDGMHALKTNELLSVTKEEIQGIYEQKNYVHLRPEELKNLRLSLRARRDEVALRIPPQTPESQQATK